MAEKCFYKVENNGCEFCSCFPCDRKDGKIVHFEKVKS